MKKVHIDGLKITIDDRYTALIRVELIPENFLRWEHRQQLEYIEALHLRGEVMFWSNTVPYEQKSPPSY